MKRFLGILVAAAWLSVSGPMARGDETDATPILDKAIAALGGEAKLAKASSVTWKGTGTITFGDNESSVKTKSSLAGIARQRREFEGDFNGNPFKVLTILDGDKGWRKFGDEVQDLDGEMLAGVKQEAYLQFVPLLILPLKTKDFKLKVGTDAKVGDKPAVVLEVTGPDGKPFTLYFDKDTGLLVKMVATIRGFQGNDTKQETTFADYKDFDGLKFATKIETTRDGNPFIKMEYSDYKVAEKPEADTFAEPK